jgi:hypothetical protein
VERSGVGAITAGAIAKLIVPLEADLQASERQ